MIYNSMRKMVSLFSILTLIFGIVLLPIFADADTDSMLETGRVVNARMKSLAAGSDKDFQDKTSEIKAIYMAESLPDNFVPSEDNIVSVPDSKYPVYIFFDDTNESGIMYFYTEADTVKMNQDSSFLFANNIALTSIIGLANWDSSSVKSMNGLFLNARSLADALALRNWDTSNVLDMRKLFCGCISLLFIDVTNWNTGKVQSMSNMFQVGDDWKGNGQLREIIGLGDLDVSNVTDMTSMFYGAGQMITYDIDRWDVSKVESMNHMFCDNFNLRSLDLSAWDVSSLKTIYNMFNDDTKLRTIGNVSHWNTVNLIDAGAWLNNASSFIGDKDGYLDLSGWNTGNLKSVGEMFFGTKMHMLDLSGWTFDSITNDVWEGTGWGIYYATGNSSESMKGFGSMFRYTPNLATIYITQAGMDSYNAAVERGVNTLDMWTATKAGGFTVK